MTAAFMPLVLYFTVPLLNFVCLLLYANSVRCTYEVIAVCELVIVFAEWGLLAYVFPHRSRERLKLSAVMNTGSYGFGLVLQG